MGEHTTASRDQIATFRTQATAAANDLHAMLTGLVNQLAPLEAYWIGRGGLAFQSTSAIVQKETLVMKAALEGIAADVATAGVLYDNADTEQGSTMSGVGANTTGITAGLIVK